MSNNRLIRDTDNAMLGGVCAGIANRLEADVTIVRLIAFGITAVTAGVGVVVYIALWLLMPAPNAAPGMPSKDALTEEVREAGERAKEAATIIGRAAKQAASELQGVAGKRAPGATPSAGAAPATDATPEASDTDPEPAGASTAAAANMAPPSDPTAPNATTADPPTGDEVRPQQP